MGVQSRPKRYIEIAIRVGRQCLSSVCSEGIPKISQLMRIDTLHACF